MISSPRVIAEWRARVAAEYHSAAVTARVLSLSIELGLPREVLETARRIVGDELDHAELCHTALEQLGGGDEPLELHPVARSEVAPGVELTDTLLHAFCFGETLAVPLFDAMRRGSTHPAVLPVLERVLRDEATHRAFAWQALDALVALDATGVRAHADAALPPIERWFRQAYASATEVAPLSADERAQGLLEPASYRAIYERTLSDELIPRFAARGITLAPSAPHGR